MTECSPVKPCYLVTLNGRILTEGLDYSVEEEGRIVMDPRLEIDEDDLVVAYEVLRKRVFREA